jgi:hypothetical protein
MVMGSARALVGVQVVGRDWVHVSTDRKTSSSSNGEHPWITGRIYNHG